MATHSSVLSWRIPRTGESGRLQSTSELEMNEVTQHACTVSYLVGGMGSLPHLLL